MSEQDDLRGRLIWATRGHSWGFRFLLTAGLRDPLPTYEHGFAGLGEDPDGFRWTGDTIALRFPDPLGRRDAAGRSIPHDLLLLGVRPNDGIESPEDCQRRLWALIAHDYARVYDLPQAPASGDAADPGT